VNSSRKSLKDGNPSKGTLKECLARNVSLFEGRKGRLRFGKTLKTASSGGDSSSFSVPQMFDMTGAMTSPLASLHGEMASSR
jgi:hypothetical protein